MPVSNEFRIRFRAPGSTVIDQMVARMTAFQQANGGRAMYSFELPDEEADWRFLGVNNASRANYKPAGVSEINDRVGSWGASGTGERGAVGYRAFEGGPWPGNVTLLEARGAQNRCVWDDAGDAMWYVGGSTGSDDGKQVLAKYNARTDEFLHWTAGRNVAATFTVDTTYFAPTTTEFEASVVCSDTGYNTDGYFVDYLVDWLPGSAVQTYDDVPGNPAQINRHVDSVTITSEGLFHFTMAYPYSVTPGHGDTGELEDSAASLWPRKGSAHNFGMSAWDPVRRRYYKIMRVAPGPQYLPIRWWVCWIDVARERAYASRADWVADRGNWFGRSAESEYFTNAAWPECVYAPEFGETGSLIIFQSDDDTIKRWDCSTRQVYTYPTSFAINVPQSKPSALSTTNIRPGPALHWHNRSLYVLSHLPGDDRTQPCQFWRFDFSADGQTVTGPVRLADPPVHMSLAGYSWPGDHTEMVSLNGQFYLFHSDTWDDGSTFRDWNGGVYRYNPTSDTWSGMLPGSESWTRKLMEPPHNIDITSLPHNFTVTEIPRLGCFLIASAWQSYMFGAFLFKPPL